MERNGEALRYIRRRAGKNQKELADLIGGLTYGAIGNYERGDRDIPQWVWDRLSDLGIIPQEIQQNTQEKQQSDVVGPSPPPDDASYYRGKYEAMKEAHGMLVAEIKREIIRLSEVQPSNTQGIREGEQEAKEGKQERRKIRKAIHEGHQTAQPHQDQ